MKTIQDPVVKCNGVELDCSPECFGELRDSSTLVGEIEALRRRLDEDGYLFMRGLLNREVAIGIRQRMLELLARDGHLDPAYPLSDGVLRNPGHCPMNTGELRRSPEIRQYLFSGTLPNLIFGLFGEPVLHFSFIWFRSVGRGYGIKAHCDFPYMNRGTFNLLTAWVSYGEIPLEVGGLMILEGSHKVTPVRCRRYLSRDVDAHCVNKPQRKPIMNNWSFDGTLSGNVRTLRDKLGGRWLTTTYRPGDVLLFGMGTVHASIDNQTDRVRLSTDTRYQPASQPADERWIGEEPIGHGADAKRYLIC